MKREVQLGIDFLIQLMKIYSTDIVWKQIHESQLTNFKHALTKLLTTHYYDHWYPELPTKGSAFRCIRNYVKIDPILEQAGINVGIEPNQLSKMLPPQLTIWIDPNEVSFRIRDNDKIDEVYDNGYGRAIFDVPTYLTEHFTSIGETNLIDMEFESIDGRSFFHSPTHLTEDFTSISENDSARTHLTEDFTGLNGNDSRYVAYVELVAQLARLKLII